MSFLQAKPQLICAALTAATAALYAGHFLWTRWQSRVLKLIIYPIKSLPGVIVDELEVTDIGVKYGPFLDRSYILLNENNLLISQRVKPKIALIEISLSGTKIILSAKGMPTLTIDVSEDLSKNQHLDFEIFKQKTAGVICDDWINKWFTDFIGSPAKLVRFIDDLHPFRPASIDVDGKVQDDHSTPIRYQDGDPILLINSASITDLKSKLLDKSANITYRNFRPNILVQLSKPFEEDSTKLFTIGDVTFENIKPCDRCTFTTVNPDTGVKHKDLEPLRTLKTYRLLGEYTSPLFGVNLKPLQQGRIKQGDLIQSNHKTD